jgi:hypothetical protein
MYRVADAAWWISLTSGALGVTGALAGTWLTQRNAAVRDTIQWQRLVRQQDDAWMRQRAERLQELRFQLYLDLMEYAEDRDRLMVHVWSGKRGRYTRVPDLQPESRLQARVLLYTEQRLRDLWVSAWQAIEAVENIFSPENAGGDGGRMSHPDEAAMSRARDAIEELQDELRRLVAAVGTAARSASG